MKKPVIFTDLDGTLLDYSTYSFDAALPALHLLKEKNIPLIISSSKTRSEIEYYRGKLVNPHPFVSENGGGIFVPKAYFNLPLQRADITFEEEAAYHVLRLGARYPDLRKALENLRAQGFSARGFGDMTPEEVAGIANMRIEEARMAKERDFDEPFVLETDENDLRNLFEEIKAMGFTHTRGRFFHIMGDSDKGKAVSILIDLYRRQYGDLATIAIGDSLNDVPMLEKVDHPVIVLKPDGSYDSQIEVPNLIKADGIGPEGWNRAVINLIEEFS